MSDTGDGVWVASFYRFHPIEDLHTLRAAVEKACSARALRGTVLLAPEGVNATLAGGRRDLAEVIDRHFPAADVKWSTAAPGNPVFQRLKVRGRPEIVSFDHPLSSSSPAGKRVDAAAWNDLIADPDVLVLDVRNGYESDIGTFRGARRTDTATFREFPDFVRRELGGAAGRPVAMFCTGGIRCEKASAYLLARGFETVCQLDGGILKYFAETSDADNAFEGECFVFDDRVSVTPELAEGRYELCQACSRPVSPTDRESPLFDPGRSCPGCHGATHRPDRRTS